MLDVDADFHAVIDRCNGFVQSPCESVSSELVGFIINNHLECGLGDEWFDDSLIFCMSVCHRNY